MTSPAVLWWAAASGAVVGLGLWVLVRACSPAGPSLAAELDRLRTPHWPGVPVARLTLADQTRRLAMRVGMSMGDSERLRGDLALLGRSAEALAVKRSVAALLFAGLPLAGFAVLQVGAVAVNPAVLLVAMAAAGAGGFFVPGWTAHNEAEEVRRAYRHALVAFLSTVALYLAAGSGPTEAMRESADRGSGSFCALMRDVLRRAQSLDLWGELASLADRIRFPELGELAGSVQVASASGAGVRDTLLAKTEALRSREAAAEEAAAGRSSELLVLPVGVMAMGFVVLIGYPAVARIMRL